MEIGTALELQLLHQLECCVKQKNRKMMEAGEKIHQLEQEVSMLRGQLLEETEKRKGAEQKLNNLKPHILASTKILHGQDGVINSAGETEEILANDDVDEKVRQVKYKEVLKTMFHLDEKTGVPQSHRSWTSPCVTPTPTPSSSTCVPQSPTGKRKSGHQKLGDSPEPYERISGIYNICTCCPRPMKFETAEDLKTHTLSSQLTCRRCLQRCTSAKELTDHVKLIHHDGFSKRDHL